jgi:hexosaminidase
MCGYSKTTVADVVNAGYRAVYSNYADLYLSPGSTWEKIYESEPLTGITDPKAQKLVIGAEVCKWGETTDFSVFDAKVWPRLAAAAETFWSPYDPTRTAASALTRLHGFRCLLIGRGIGAAPLMTGLAPNLSPRGPGSCSTQ